MSSRPLFYYGWVIAICSLLVMSVTNGTVLAGYTAFDNDLLTMLRQATGEQGLTGELKLRDLITLAVSGLIAPLVGAIADRIGVRPLMVTGLALLALGNYLYASADSLSDIYLIHLLLAGTLAGAGLLMSVMLVSKWFVRHRGFAVGLTVAGTSIGNWAMPRINVMLIERFGWQDAFLYGAILPLLLIPVVLFVIREKPSDMGLAVPGADEAASGSPYATTGMAYLDALRTPSFWLLASIAMLTFYSVLGLLQHIFLYVTSSGLSQATAANAVGGFALMGLLGKLISGLLADVLGRKRVFLATLCVMCSGAWMMLFTAQLGLWTPLLLAGIGWGGLYTLLQMLAADIFGVRELGKILGTITVLDAIGGGLGPAVTGFLRDQSGSYQLPFTVIAVFVTAALLLAGFLRIPKRG